jgi:predicted ATPase/DNA-binding winged helix-turn-helix (wHTH) protein
VLFGPFLLRPGARALERNGAPVAIGSRAMDILLVLVARAGDVVSHRELVARVWRGLVVASGTLRVHVAALRSVLQDRDATPRYIANIPGQGYAFIGAVRRGGALPLPVPAASTGARRTLPPRLARMVGREGCTALLAGELMAHRFVTIVGPGGMGKTVVALAVAHAVAPAFGEAVHFIDLGTVEAPADLAQKIAEAVGIVTDPARAMADLRQWLAGTRMLLVLDNCEHLLEAVAAIAEQLFAETEVHLLATSREALRVEGERACPLAPLATPAEAEGLDAASAMAYPAVQLFVERVHSSGKAFALTDADAPLVAGICCRLDGLPLAIELAAGRVGTYGLQGTAELLLRRLGLYWRGRRTAMPRHQTLHALIDWSYQLLGEGERRMLQSLSVFGCSFTLDEALALAWTPGRDAVALADDLGGLVAKSLVAVAQAPGAAVRYRLLETTRAYAHEKLRASGLLDATVQRHVAGLARRGGAHTPGRPGTVLAALWCLEGRPRLGVLRPIRGEAAGAEHGPLPLPGGAAWSDQI